MFNNPYGLTLVGTTNERPSLRVASRQEGKTQAPYLSVEEKHMHRKRNTVVTWLNSGCNLLIDVYISLPCSQIDNFKCGKNMRALVSVDFTAIVLQMN